MKKLAIPLLVSFTRPLSLSVCLTHANWSALNKCFDSAILCVLNSIASVWLFHTTWTLPQHPLPSSVCMFLPLKLYDSYAQFLSTLPQLATLSTSTMLSSLKDSKKIYLSCGYIVQLSVLGCSCWWVDASILVLCPLEVRRESADLVILFKLLSGTFDCPDFLARIDFRVTQTTQVNGSFRLSSQPVYLFEVWICIETSSPWQLRTCWGGLVLRKPTSLEAEIPHCTKVLNSYFPSLFHISMITVIDFC